MTDLQKLRHQWLINSPLKGTTVMKPSARLFLPQHLIDVFIYDCDFVKKLREQSIETKKAGVHFFHTATEADG